AEHSAPPLPRRSQPGGDWPSASSSRIDGLSLAARRKGTAVRHHASIAFGGARRPLERPRLVDGTGVEPRRGQPEHAVPHQPMTWRVACLDEDTVYSYVNGQLETADHEAAAAHLDRCAECRQVVAVMVASVGEETAVPAPDRYLRLRLLGAGGMGVVY